MRVIITRSGLMSCSYEMVDYEEIKMVNHPSLYQTGRERRRSDRKRFKTEGYIKKTLIRGGCMKTLN